MSKMRPTLTKGVAKVPVVMQLEALECGAACLDMVMAYYGKWVPLEQVRLDCGISRDGSKAKNIFLKDPFASIDTKGVGQLVETAALKSRRVRKNISLGVCGEHGGDPDSISFFNKIGLNYVSCSPYRVPIARLAAAQAVVNK